MVPYLELVIAFLVLTHFFNFYVDCRQIKRFQNVNRPQDLSEIVQEEEYTKAQKYGFDKLSAQVLSKYFSWLVSILTLYYHLLPYLWNESYKLVGEGIPQVLTFVFIQSIIEFFLETPFKIYQIFVVEERFGFNKQTMGLFIKDTVKSLLITWIIQGLVLSAIVYIMNNAGDLFYLYIWGFLTVVIFVFIMIYHDLIAPLFNTFTPLGGDNASEKEKELKVMIEKLAENIGFPLTQIYVVDGSKRSDHSNAYFYGFWKNKRIVIFDTLLDEEKKIENNEILAIVAHELGHWHHMHLVQRLVILEVIIFVMFYTFGFVVYNPEFYRSFGFTDTNKFIGLVLFNFVFSPVNFVLQVLLTKLSRTHEFQADDFSKKLDLSSYLRTGLIKIFTQNSANMDPDPLYSALHFSHPALRERLGNLGGLSKSQQKFKIQIPTPQHLICQKYVTFHLPSQMPLLTQVRIMAHIKNLKI